MHIILLLDQDGITVVNNDTEHTFHGTVFLALADTQAAHQLGGYKEGVGFSLRKCRDCMATFSDMQTKVCGMYIDSVEVRTSGWTIMHASTLYSACM